MKRNFARQFLTLSTCAVIAFTNGACDPPGSSGLLQGQGGQADGLGGQGGQGGAASSSSGGSSGGQGGAASSSSSGSSGGQGGAASSSSSSSSSSGQAGAGGGGACLDGQTQSCYSGPLGTENIGACIGGSRTCVGGMFEGCIGEITPSIELCDNVDNDCNGQVDEGNPGGGSLCSTGMLGICSQGSTACSGGNIVCNAVNQPQAEVCDGLDNNCNGQVDEGNPGGGSTCNTGQSGVCGIGTTACSGGSIVCNVTNQPQAEVCDGLDNNCNGQVDEGNPGSGFSCSTGQPGACAAGITACSGGAVACNAINQPKAEVCDGLDNNCNGQVDDGNPEGGLTCNTGQLGICGIGTTACSGGSVVCNVTNQPQVEVCDAFDNDCDGQINEGNPGGNLTCNTGQFGECAAGKTLCSGNAISCVALKQPTAEICDSLDNDCDGQVDDGNPGGGALCQTGQPGVCASGKMTCSGGAMVCSPINPPQPEACDMLDNNCDGQVDEGNPGLGMPCNTGQIGACGVGSAECVGGTIVCHVVNQPSPEICDNIDNDCDGQVDEGNPGGGMDCGPSIGGCGQKTVCNNGAIVCGGTFVGPIGVGAPGNPGTPAQPLSTIAAAQAKAAIIGGDICLCDTPASGPSTYQEDVTMVEGVGIYGGYNCADWSRDINTYVTRIKGWVNFTSGITSATTLDGLYVEGSDYTAPQQQPDFSTAIFITNSSPRLVNVKASGGQADYSIGLSIATSNGGSAAPTVIGGVYGANGNGYGVYSGQTGIRISKAGGTFTNVTISASGSGENATGFDCWDCSAQIVGSSITGVFSQKYANGLYVTGNVSGFSITNTTINGGYGNGANGIATGIRLANCIGSPTVTGATVNGGSSVGTSYGIVASGSSCAPNIIASTVHGGNAPNGSVGVWCYGGSACVVKDSSIEVGVNGQVSSVLCSSGGCSFFSGNLIRSGTLTTSWFGGSTVEINQANPIFEDNEIVGPACPSALGNMGSLAIAKIVSGAPTFTNNVFRDQPCVKRVEVVRLENAGPMLRNNTIQFATCSGCGAKYGLFVNGSTSMAIASNNIFFNAGSADFTNAFAVAENTASSDLPIFTNNLLWTPNGGTLYFDEGSSALSLAAINALSGSTGNISADPMLDSTFHLLPGSPCRNAGTATGAPAFDFDGNTRPQEMVHDIGADEYVP